ncbi:Hsp70 family protein [Frateuria aurantia]
MHLGIDFGTSYSAAAAIRDGQLHCIRFGDAQQFRTAAFFPEHVPDPNDFLLTPALEAQMNGLKRDGASEKDALRIVRRQWMEEQMRQSEAVSVGSLKHALFGDAAIEAYLLEGTGHLIESPKSMLGYRLDPRVRQTIVSIATHILEHIRLTASQQLGSAIRHAVIGRPVEFRSSMGADGGEQALSILRDAAGQAGFDAISFVEEPAAAAMHYHQSLGTRQPALIVDIGGGTTDVAWAELGGDEPARILRSWGLARGGTDLDSGISLRQFMPLLGSEVQAIPAHHYVAAASVHHLPKQREFRQQDYRRIEPPFGPRLRALQELGATTRLNRRAEETKIGLSSGSEHAVNLGFLERGLDTRVDTADFAAAVEDFVERLRRLLEQVKQEWPSAPASIFLTGGSSRSPLLQQLVGETFAGIPLVKGDPSLGVVSGLAVAPTGSH